jgi:hypothetical protein
MGDLLDGQTGTDSPGVRQRGPDNGRAFQGGTAFDVNAIEQGRHLDIRQRACSQNGSEVRDPLDGQVKVQTRGEIEISPLRRWIRMLGSHGARPFD